MCPPLITISLQKGLLLNKNRTRLYFVRPTIAIAKIRDYSQSTLPAADSNFFAPFRPMLSHVSRLAKRKRKQLLRRQNSV